MPEGDDGTASRFAAVAMLAGVAVLAVAGLAAVTRSHDPVESATVTTSSTPTTTAAQPSGCQTDDPTAPAPSVSVGAAGGKPGTTGKAAGFSPGGELFFDPPDDALRELDAAAATGVRWLRLDLDWSYLEPARGHFAWCRADRVIAAARERGLDVLLVPAFAPVWASDPAAGDGFHRAPADPADYAAFVAAAVRRYEPIGVKAWEIWNEPNVSAFWKPAPDVKAYVAVLRAGYTAVKSVDPTATVITGGLAPAADADDGTTIAISTFLRSLYDDGAKGSFDAFGVHPYSVPARPLESHDWNPFSHLTEYHTVMADHGDGAKAIWMTEFGAPTGYGAIAVHDDVQGEIAADAFTATAAWPWAGPLFWYAIRDLGKDLFDSGQNWGLLRRNFTPKPGYAEFTQLMATPRPIVILVDDAIWPWRGERWAHLVSDHSYEELHEFADRLGWDRRRFQGDHYDIPATVRTRAIEFGAEPVGGRELVRRLRAAGLRKGRRAQAAPEAGRDESARQSDT